MVVKSSNSEVEPTQTHSRLHSRFEKYPFPTRPAAAGNLIYFSLYQGLWCLGVLVNQWQALNLYPLGTQGAKFALLRRLTNWWFVVR